MAADSRERDFIDLWEALRTTAAAWRWVVLGVGAGAAVGAWLAPAPRAYAIGTVDVAVQRPVAVSGPAIDAPVSVIVEDPAVRALAAAQLQGEPSSETLQAFSGDVIRGESIDTVRLRVATATEADARRQAEALASALRARLALQDAFSREYALLQVRAADADRLAKLVDLTQAQLQAAERSLQLGLAMARLSPAERPDEQRQRQRAVVARRAVVSRVTDALAGNRADLDRARREAEALGPRVAADEAAVNHLLAAGPTVSAVEDLAARIEAHIQEWLQDPDPALTRLRLRRSVIVGSVTTRPPPPPPSRVPSALGGAAAGALLAGVLAGFRRSASA